MQITNTFFYLTTKELEFSWTLCGDGYELGSRILSVPIMDPQSSYTIEYESGPWHSLWASSFANEHFLTITAKLLEPRRWVEAGHVISSTQILLPAKREFVPHVIALFVFLHFFQ